MSMDLIKPRFLFLVSVVLSVSISMTVQALEYEFSDNGLDAVEWDGGRTEYEFADIDNDGHVDILSIGDHGAGISERQHGILVHFGDGTGRWRVEMRGEFGYGGIAIGDVNNDGDWDVGYGMHHDYAENDFGDQQIEVVLGDGSGENWEPWDDGLAAPRNNDDWYGMFGTDFGDINNDGLLDIGSNSFGSGTGLHIYHNLGNGEWEDAFYYFGRMNSACDFVFGDINNDGNLDFACTLEDMEVYLSDGEGNFEFAQFNLPNPPEFEVYLGVDLGDADNDGADDLAFVDGDCQVCVFTYDPERERWNDISDGLPGDRGAWRIDLCDMDMDGNKDIIFSGSEGLEVWLQDPDGDPRWSEEWSMGFEDYSGIQALRAGGDIDHNGLPDIVILVRIRINMMQTRNFIHVLRETSEAEELWIRPVEPGGNELIHAGAARFIDWMAAVPGGEEAEIDLFFSFRGPDGPWEPIVEDFPNGGRYQWIVPGMESRNCFIKYRITAGDETAEAVTPTSFSIIGGDPVPILVIEPMRIEFEDIDVNASAETPLIIRNTGFSEMIVQPLELAIGDVFSFEGGEEEFQLDVDAEEEITVAFTPPEQDMWLDTLFVGSDGGDAAVTLVGRTVGVRGPMLVASPDELDFGRVHVDSVINQRILLINRGDRDAVVNIAGSNDASLTWEPVEDEPVAPEDTLAVVIECSPVGPGNLGTSLVVGYQMGEISVDIVGFGYGIVMLELSAEELIFGPVNISRSAILPLTIYNRGDTARVDIPESQRPQFSWEPVMGAVLLNNDSLVVETIFDPEREGFFESDLVIRHQQGELTVALEGLGIAGALLEPSVQSIDFGQSLINADNLRDLVIYSCGQRTAEFEIDAPDVGPFYWQEMRRQELDPGDSLVVTINFYPEELGEFQGTFRIDHQDGLLRTYLEAECVDEVSVNREVTYPMRFGISKAMPNPFNSELHIEYSVEIDGYTELMIWDISGRLVHVIESGNKHPGSHSITLNLDDLTSGTYLLILTQDSERDLRKVVFLR